MARNELSSKTGKISLEKKINRKYWQIIESKKIKLRLHLQTYQNRV
jgi:hypothetical protein